MPTKETQRLLLAHGLSFVMKNENDEDLVRIHHFRPYVEVIILVCLVRQFFCFRSIVLAVALNLTRASFFRVLQTL